MTNEEAKELLRNAAWLGTDNGMYVYKAVNKATKALEKQIPKKVVHRALRQTEWGSPWHCPECEAELIEVCFGDDENKVSYCWHCGSALDWSEDE